MKSSQRCLREKSSMSVCSSLGCGLTLRTSETPQTKWGNLTAQPALAKLHQQFISEELLIVVQTGMTPWSVLLQVWRESQNAPKWGGKESSCLCPTARFNSGWSCQRHPRAARLEKAQKQPHPPGSAQAWKCLKTTTGVKNESSSCKNFLEHSHIDYQNSGKIWLLGFI